MSRVVVNRVGLGRIARRCGVAAIGTSAVSVLIVAGGAFAHIAPSPIAIEAGKPATITFDVEHGCAGSNTIGLDIKMPEGVADAAAVDKTGWTTSAAGGVVHFAGGNLDANKPDTFSITLTAPTTAGEINFPIVQKCVVGESDWITIQQDGQPEPEFPAAQVKVTNGPPTSADLVVVPDEETDATGATTAGTSVVTGSAPAVTIAAPKKADDSSNGGVIIAIVAAVIVVGGVGGYLVVRKKPAR